MSVRTRFAPSPTGHLHIGSARVALFNYLFARHHGGQFVLRIEDTDRARSTRESVQTILDGLAWLGLPADEGPIYQTHRFDRYRKVVQQLLDDGHAYHCYCTPDEVAAMREQAMAEKRKPRYNGYWRDRTDPPPAGVPPVVRFRNPLAGDVVIHDAIKGDIVVSNTELDDLVIMRSDGSPTYNLTVVVDDIDMAITHVIRGDDHVNNTPRQINLFKALGAELPVFAHLPMILGPDGKKMSKRHGATGVMQYAHEGYLPQAMRNYLVRLGWSHGDQELFSDDEMIRLFTLEAVNRAGSVFDIKKLGWVNERYLQAMPARELADALDPFVQRHEGSGPPLAAVAELLRERASTLVEMAAIARWFYTAPDAYDDKAVVKHFDADVAVRLQATHDALAGVIDWQAQALEAGLKDAVGSLGVGFGKVGLPLRLALTGNTATPPLGQTLELIGREATLARLQTAIDWCQARC